MANKEYSSENSVIIGFGNGFLGITPKAQTTKATINEGLHQTRRLLTAKEAVDEMKKQSLKQEKILHLQPMHLIRG